MDIQDLSGKRLPGNIQIKSPRYQARDYKIKPIFSPEGKVSVRFRLSPQAVLSALPVMLVNLLQGFLIAEMIIDCWPTAFLVHLHIHTSLGEGNNPFLILLLSP